MLQTFTNYIGRTHRVAILVAIGILLTACAPSISQFNETAYQQAVQLKVKSMSLIDKANEPYSAHEEAAVQLKQNLLTAYEYAKGRPSNEISTRQWEIMVDAERNLMGGFLVRWKEQETLSPAFIGEYSKVIADAFDTIIGLESGKIKPGEVE
ncbi:hypothetical protein [Gracilimonas sp. BCB1]|uniref:hypothetical protein n=1 Tax=Gracilimonas sp. BCB1 TaxID=3152362 RepID=UPI0032D919B0